MVTYPESMSQLSSQQLIPYRKLTEGLDRNPLGGSVLELGLLTEARLEIDLCA